MHLSGHADAGKEEQYRGADQEASDPLSASSTLPMSRILWGWIFMSMKNVLIPRQDTEVLVEHTLKFVRDDMRVLDMCTGSGCIIVSIGGKPQTGPGGGR